MRIKVIRPTITPTVSDDEVGKMFASYAFPGTQVSVTHLDYGPASVESEFDEAICIPDFLRKAQQAEAEGFDAVISNCFGDPGVKPARELLSIPVVGAAESSMHLAATLGQRFSVVTALSNTLPLIENLALQYGLDRKLASVRSVSIPVLQLGDRERLVKALHQEMVRALSEDRAHVIVLGCTGMRGVARELQEQLSREGHEIPVIDPMAAALKFSEALVSMGLKQSRITAMTPPEKERTELPLFGTRT
jgi:allantoin racemase